MTTRQGYRRWEGKRVSGRLTWTAIVANGLRLSGKGFVARLIMMANVLLLGACLLGFYGLSQLELLSGTRQGAGLLQLFSRLLNIEIPRVDDFSTIRVVLWRSFFLLVLRAQIVLVVLGTARVGANLICRDLRSNALPIYFARPVTPITYVFAKWLVVACVIGTVMLVPNLLTLLCGAMLTGELEHFWQILALAGDLIVSGLIMMVLSGSVILALSSLTSDSRYVVISWLAVVLLPQFAQAVIREGVGRDRTIGFLASISPYDNFTRLATWILDLRESWSEIGVSERAINATFGQPISPFYPATVFLGIILISLVIAYRRVVKFSRMAANIQ